MTPFAKRLSIILAVSIALNLLFVGIAVGRRFHRHPPMPPPERGELAPRPQGAPRESFGNRPEREGRRGEFRKLFREQSQALGGHRRTMGDARRAAREALEKEPFDRAALEKALETLRKETTASQEVMHKALADAAAKGSPDERRQLARGLERANFGRNGRGANPSGGR
jgi:uncharacterized membrane protein